MEKKGHIFVGLMLLNNLATYQIMDKVTFFGI